MSHVEIVKCMYVRLFETMFMVMCIIDTGLCEITGPAYGSDTLCGVDYGYHFSEQWATTFTF